MSHIPSTIKEINRLVNTGKLSYTELSNYYLDNLQKQEDNLAAFLFINKKITKEAEKLDKLKAAGKKLAPLTGMVFSLKDNILEKGNPATAGSRILRDYIASYDATAVKKLKQQQALCIGKTNLDEFGMGSSTENSAFQTTRNPFNQKKVPGGSSGGAAASVMANECLFALGTDTGGSIRQPAAFCGAVGFKPTYGRVSRHGLIALASSLDVIGSITRTVEDAAEVFYAIAGQDNYDATSLEGEDKPVDLFMKKPQDFVIGVPEEYFPSELDGDINKVIHQRIDEIAKAGFKVQKIKLPHTLYGLAAYYIIMPSEASANLARYDTLRYGLKAKEKSFKDIIDFYIKTRTKNFGDEVRRRIMLGVYALSAGYYDDYYIKAQQTKRILQDEFEKAFKKVDVLITPTTPTVAFDIGAQKSPLEMYFSDIFTVPASLAGLPALSMPVGKKDNLPIGMQLIGKKCHERDVFEVARYLEKHIF